VLIALYLVSHNPAEEVQAKEISNAQLVGATVPLELHAQQAVPAKSSLNSLLSEPHRSPLPNTRRAVIWRPSKSYHTRRRGRVSRLHPADREWQRYRRYWLFGRSGGTGSQDEAIRTAGAAAVNKQPVHPSCRLGELLFTDGRCAIEGGTSCRTGRRRSR
jgi:hypothetical protein